MAVFGGDIALSSSKAWSGKISWYYSQSVLLNTTTITAYVTAKTLNDTTQTLGNTCFYGTISIGGKQASFAYDVEKATETQHFKFEAEIRHNGAGRLPECVINCTINAAASENWDFSSGTLTGGADIARYLPIIPTESNFDAIEDIEFGQNVSVSWTPKSASYYYKISFLFENKKYEEVVHPGTTSLYTYRNFSIPNDWAYEIPTKAIGFCNVQLNVYDNSFLDSEVDRQSSATFTITVPNSFVPTISQLNARINNDDTAIPSDWDIAVSGHSRVTLTANASGVYGSTVKSFNIYGPTYANIYSSNLNFTTDIIRAVGSKDFTITCVDSRGRKSAEYKTSLISFVDYSDPKVVYFNASRSKNANTGVVTLSAIADWEFSSVNDKNNASATLYYKIADPDVRDWTVYGIANTFPKNERIQLDITVEELSSYNFRIEVVDSLNKKAVKEAFSASNYMIMDFKAGGDGVAIGGVCEQPGFTVYPNTRLIGDISIGPENIPLNSYVESFIDPLLSIDIPLYSSEWISSSDGTAPYYQTYNVQGMTANRDYAPPFLFGEKDLETLLEEEEALACISYGKTNDGSVTFYCLEEKPQRNITVRIQGVKV